MHYSGWLRGVRGFVYNKHNMGFIEIKLVFVIALSIFALAGGWVVW